jgi:hypothetical protein
MTLKNDILELHKTEPGLANYQIAERLNTDRRVVWAAINNYKYKDTDAYKLSKANKCLWFYSGNSRKIPEYLKDIIIQHAEKHPEASCKEISQELMIQLKIIKTVLLNHGIGTPVEQYIKRLRLNSAGRLRIETLTYYGGGIAKCAMCGTLDMRVLTIDHINGGGNKHRKSIQGSAGSNFYKWLKDNYYPGGYQVLCANCQWIKRVVNKECKH